MSPRVLAALAAVGCLVTAARGTRLPDSACARAQQQEGLAPQTGASGSATPLPGASKTAGPGASTGPGGQGGQGPGAQGGGGGSGGSGGSGDGKPNTASDVGVTASTITIGNIVSKTNPFDPRAFVGPSYGIEAFV